MHTSLGLPPSLSVSSRLICVHHRHPRPRRNCTMSNLCYQPQRQIQFPACSCYISEEETLPTTAHTLRIGHRTGTALTNSLPCPINSVFLTMGVGVRRPKPTCNSISSDASRRSNKSRRGCDRYCLTRGRHTVQRRSSRGSTS